VFYNGFEENGTPGDAKTGLKYHAGGDYIIPTNEQPHGYNLVMTYWFFKDESWQYQDEIDYDPVISNAGAARIDELRVFPKTAQMTTYNYNPGVNLITTTDANSNSSYYEYDDLTRLKIIRDLDSNKVSEINYKYQN